MFKCKDSKARLQGKLKSRNMTPLKDHINFPVTDPEEMEIYKLSDRGLRIIILRKLSKL